MPRLALCLAAALLASSALVNAPLLEAQAAPTSPAVPLPVVARSKYYNLYAVGVSGFSCKVVVDWHSLFQLTGAADAPELQPTIAWLKNVAIDFTNPLAGTPEVHWNASAPIPDGQQDSIAQIKSGVLQMLPGFLTTWNSTLNGTLIPIKPTSFAPSSTGFLLTDKQENTAVEETFDKDLHITHISVVSSELNVQMDSTFTSSDRGLILTRAQNVVRQPPTAPPIDMTMIAAFAPVDDIQIPATLNILMPNVLNMKMQFTACTLQRQPTAPPAANPKNN